MDETTDEGQAPNQEGTSAGNDASMHKTSKDPKRIKRRKIIGFSLLAVIAVVVSFFLGRLSVQNVGISIGGSNVSTSQDASDVPTTEGKVGTPIVRDNYEFTVESFELLPEGKGDMYSPSTLKEQDSREFHVNMSTKSKWQYSFGDMRMSVNVPQITVNGQYQYCNTVSQTTGGQAGGIGHETLCFAIPNDVANSIDSIDFDYELNEDPSDKSGGTFTTKQTSEGPKLGLTTPKHTVRYHFKLQ